jgi:hypothetical protein
MGKKTAVRAVFYLRLPTVLPGNLPVPRLSPRGRRKGGNLC